MPDNTELLFTYGTLKRGFHNNCVLGASSKFVGEAISVSPQFVMRTGGYPILWEEAAGSPGPTGRVRGELFAISSITLRRCDGLEGHPYTYKREQQSFIDVGRECLVKAWVYLWVRPDQIKRWQPMEMVDGVYDWRGARTCESADD